MKKTLSLLMVIVLCLSAISGSVFAEEETETTAAEKEIVVADTEDASSEEAVPDTLVSEETDTVSEPAVDDADIDTEVNAAMDTGIAEAYGNAVPNAMIGEITDDGTKAAGVVYDSWVNPVYADLYKEGSIQVKPEEAKGQTAVNANAVSFTSVDEAAVYVRNQMKLRNTEISFTITFLNGYSGTEWGEIMSRAMSHTGLPDEGDYIRYHLSGYRLRASYSGDTYTPVYTVDYLSNTEQEAAVDTAAENAISGLSLDGKSDFEKVRKIHDFVVNHVTYDYDHLGQDYDLQYTSYAALLNGTAVCQGYASLTYRLMLTAGVDCRVITGTANNGSGTWENHAWNIVKLNGQYYYLDTTWDDGTHGYTYFLKSGFSDHKVDSTETTLFTDAFFAEYPISASDFTEGEDIYTISVEVSDHGTVISDKENAGVGERVMLTVMPDSDGTLTSLSVLDAAGNAVPTSAGSDGTYTFDMPIGNVTVKAEFSQVVMPAFKTHSLTLSGKIGVNFYMDLPEIEGVNWKDSYMTFTVNGRSTDVAFDETNKNATGQYYGFTIGVNSIQMAETITAEFHYGEGQTISETYSIEQYLEVFDENKKSFDEFTRYVVEAMADYGHYVQPFLSKANGWTIGADYAAMNHYYMQDPYDIPSVRGFVEDFAIAKSINTEYITKINYRLIMDSETAIEVIFTVADGYEGRFTPIVNGKITTAVKMEDGRYAVKVPNISAHLLGTSNLVTVLTDQGNAKALVSALSYVKDMMGAYTDVDYLNAGAALFYYYEAAITYKENQ